ncbi:hypothetical protein H704_00306 [Bartonella bacilliformis Peru38]|uniref:Lipoprotein n=2 Tax=Bartonella bacilliformis TaxID=774 RepID=A0ABN0IH53_BARBA|nr:hypothetical protein [Bartonella bacilliformis]ABM44504.1 putative lipoprotein [Bartonella bacilliformis KC583]AMG85505.1 hypothetical protein AL467_01660 [Bartonella bacilliformis]EKS45774.1 putative lipoprotein [Bartonella bacilliformis INS]EYS90208.1 hypothetical protein X472_00664 [Bartonella bacilliformis San Pedro600-02]EYS94888.1 hypothetical protein X470_00398 [Bartonella bacilliformis Peru-18]
MKHIYSISCLTITALLLAACSFSQYYGQYPFVRNIPNGIDGEWIDTNGIVSSFHNGIFETRAADTEEKLSEGIYNYVNTQHVEIEIHSILRGTISRADCTISNNAMQLFCTSSNGLQFSLNRKI